VLYLPHLFSWVIVGGMWIFMLSPNVGIVNVLRGLLGLEPVYFMTREGYARAIMIAVNLWKQAGFVCILYLATLTVLDPELILAAMIDGAGAFKRAVSITLPQLSGTLRVVLLLNVMGALRMFDQIWVMRNPVIAPKIDVLMYYVYQRGLVQFKIGYAAAVSVLVFLLTLALTTASNRFIRYAA
jgi:putative aldouronate transport system permease protein